MSETVKNKHVKKKNSAVLLLKTVITAVLLFFTWYLCSHFMEYQKNATNQVNKYRIDQVCQLSAGSAVSQKFVAKHTHLKTVKVYFGNDYSGQASGKVILNIIDLETGKSIQRLTKNIAVDTFLLRHRIEESGDRKSTRLNSSHITRSRMPSSA